MYNTIATKQLLVTVQENGIIRNNHGYLIGRLVKDIDYESEHLKTNDVQDDDRQVICNIISNMLDHPDEHGIYPTTKAYNELEEYIAKIRQTNNVTDMEWLEVVFHLEQALRILGALPQPPATKT